MTSPREAAIEAAARAILTHWNGQLRWCDCMEAARAAIEACERAMAQNTEKSEGGA